MKVLLCNGTIVLAAMLAAGCMQTSGGPESTDRTRTIEGASEGARDAVPDTRGTGAYPAIKEVAESLRDHVVYRPADLNGMGERKLGVVLWGNGGCSADGASARQHLLEIASHGYIAIAPGEVRSGPGAVARLEPPRPQVEGRFPPVETLPEDLLEGLDWILAENARPQSAYYGRIDPRAIAAAGHSCGGLQAIAVSADPRIATTIAHNSGVLNPETANPITGLSVEKADLERLHAPIFYVLGGEGDMAYPNGMDDFSRIVRVPVAVASHDVGHGGTFHEANGGSAAEVAVKWLEWRLRGDEAAGQWFAGAECVLCGSSEWSYQAKGF
jgi:dienelactone hydrolase